jgi:acetylglutamate kinase
MSGGAGFAGAGAGSARVVLKLGGRVASGAAEEALALREAGHEVVVVHGAGPQISSELERRAIPIRFVSGRRVTTPEVLEVVRESLLEVNAEVCAAIGPDAVRLAGDEIGLQAEPVPELGLVGDPVPFAPVAVVRALSAGFVPVIAPLATHPALGTLNVNADEAAAALAVALGAERILFLSDVPGVLVDGDVVASLPVADADRMLGAGEFEGGIVPKLTAAVRAARKGVHAEIGQTRVHA